MKIQRRVTSQEVAKLAGVSQPTVSRTFTPGGNVSEKVRKKVLAAAKKLGYKPNAIARSLITQRSNMIGVIMGDIANPFYPEVLRILTNKLQDEGLRLMLFTVPHEQSVDDILPQVMEYQVDGVIITSAKISSDAVEDCVKQGKPVVLFNRYARDTLANAVCCDNVEGGRVIANFLADAGHQRIAMVTGDPDTSTAQDRERGFMSRLEERGFQHVAHRCGYFTYEGGAEAARNLLAVESPPDAVFCCNDIMAVGFMDTARNEFGLKVPDDISVIGFDDVSLAAWPSFSLTTAKQRINRMTDETITILKNHIEDPEMAPVMRLVPGILMLRNSCRLPDRLDGYAWEIRKE